MAKRALVRSLSDIDIRLVRIFITVTECGGFAASELELNIGRSTISKHISDLELRIGLKLCNRGPSGFSLTPEGEKVLIAARRLLTSIDGFQSEIDNIHTNLTGTLRIGLFDQSSTNPKARIHAAIRTYDQTAPDVSLEVALAPPSPLEARVAEGTLDIAIVPAHRQSTLLNYTQLYTERMSLYCAEGHPLYETAGQTAAASASGNAGDLSDAGLDLSGYKYAGYAFNSPNMKAGQTLGVARAARVQEEEAICLLVQSGCYLGYLADRVAETLQTQGELRPVDPARTSYVSTFAAITRRSPEPDRKTMEFLKCLVGTHNAETNAPTAFANETD